MRHLSLLVVLVVGLIAASPTVSALAQDPAATPATATAPVEFLWQSTGGSDPLLYSGDVAIHPDGTVWVLDHGHNRIVILSPDDGHVLETWGEAGSGEGQFKLLQENPDGGLSLDAAGNIYVADFFNRRVQKFGPDRSFVKTWGSFGQGDGQFVAPTGITVDRAGNVYVADLERNDVQKFDADGQWLMTFGEAGTGPGQLDGASGPTVDADGNLYVAEFRNNRVSKFAPDGTFLTSWGARGTGSGQFQSSNAVAVDAAGNLYVADNENFRIQVLDAEGRFLFEWHEAGPGGGFFPASTELDGQGNIYVADIGNSRILKFRLLPPLAPEATPSA